MGMGLITKSKSSNSSEGWGMGFLLVFFPEEHHHQNQEQETTPTAAAAAATTNKKPNNFNLFPNSSSPLRRNNSNHHLLNKAQSTISICLLLLFTTLLLFTLSTLPSSAATTAAAARRHLYRIPRRHLSSRPDEPSSLLSSSSGSNLSHALQGMGNLYRRGSRAMSELVVAHATESLTPNELKLFLRLFHRSTLASRSDLLLLFPSKMGSFDTTILGENESFFKLLTQYKSSNNSHSSASFDVTHFMKLSKKERESGEPIWGRRIRSNSSEEDATESTRPSYGSVLGFDVEELDPENSLSGFLDHVPMSLRRWACYPMLLGRVRRNFKHVMLVDVKEYLLLGDPLGRVRSQSPESVLLTQSVSGKHGRRTQATRQKTVNPGIVMGGSRGVRRLSNAMLTDIVRASMQHRKKNSITESGLFTQLVGNEFVLKNVNVVVSTESVPDLSSLSGSNSKSGFLAKNNALIRRGNSNLDANSVVMKHICSFPIDSTVYSDC
ncbi:hypothetical protein ABFS82_10G163600 [Erythranthe guttata]|uniref:DUF7780 domain-containing protein n=1 Tax=Erythranthe guttata TaxID=4155 RepID=A0A022PSH3_ERYGU|nr:PREDICTED: uncharacterized protein LOC105949392 [Erythranthe guttata]XP_012828147.1 PREDICTED: uncharacterized protein LOC105949392 [Erythranthe guttata]EYU18731.1 hypothetical protein MIMGU_mgv1a005173mg [Erythranthe guttata]|eukprot:XP_012828146.1 PREDICTED: uncharacterized protein LOC105949392 [Erythranthe guttata]